LQFQFQFQTTTDNIKMSITACRRYAATLKGPRDPHRTLIWQNWARNYANGDCKIPSKRAAIVLLLDSCAGAASSGRCTFFCGCTCTSLLENRLEISMALGFLGGQAFLVVETKQLVQKIYGFG